MRPRICSTPLLFALACGPSEGQRVRALLFDEVLTCEAPEEGLPPQAVLQLDQPEDLYTAEVINLADQTRVIVPSTRKGRSVTFTCPVGLGSFTVRRVSVLTASRAPTDEADDTDDAPPAPP